MKVLITKTEFFALFTEAERGLYFAALDAGNVNVRTLREHLLLAPYDMERNGQMFQQSVGILAQEHVITNERYSEIISA